MSATTFFVTLNHYTCPTCGVIYGLEANLDAKRREDGREFYCSNGHSLSYHETALMRSEKAAKRAQELLDWERRANQSLRDEKTRLERSRSAIAGAKTRLQNRIKHGVCPCCNRTFKQLAEHMKAKHPEFVADIAR